MQNLRISVKFFILIGCFGFFTLAVSIYSTRQMTLIGQSYDGLIATKSEASLMIVRASRMLETARAAIGDLVMSDTDTRRETARAELKSTRADFERFITAAEALAGSRSEGIRALRNRGIEILDQACGPSIKPADPATGDAVRHNIYLDRCAALFPSFSLQLRAAVDGLVAEANQHRATLADETSMTTKTTFGMIIGGFALALVLGSLAVHVALVRPILQLSQTMGAIAGGDLDAVVAGTERKDEIGAMSKSVLLFREAGRQKLSLERHAETGRLLTEEERARNEAIRAQAAMEQRQAIERVGTALARLAQGDLTCALVDGFAADYVRLRDDFNAALKVLQSTLQAITANSIEVASGSKEIAHASDELARSTEKQAANLEETAAAVEQITIAVRRSADHARQARAASLEARQRTNSGTEIVKAATAAMVRIQNSSARICEIVDVIDNIAFQTNLLALNAGVEAARAGETGRGFAVVAHEVRELAKRCAGSIKEISGIVTDSVEAVAMGVSLVAETGAALAAINERVEIVDAAIREIASSASEQAVGLGQINVAVGEMDGSTQQNAAMVEESTAASRALASEAETLAALVGRFRLPELPDVRSSQAPSRGRGLAA
jgi:methyl-accepting chemotaxis protein